MKNSQNEPVKCNATYNTRMQCLLANSKAAVKLVPYKRAWEQDRYCSNISTDFTSFPFAFNFLSQLILETNTLLCVLSVHCPRAPKVDEEKKRRKLNWVLRR